MTAEQIKPEQRRQVDVRLTITPHTLTTVYEDELPGLRAQGLLVKDDGADGTAAPKDKPAGRSPAPSGTAPGAKEGT